MIPVAEAKKIISENVVLLKSVTLPIEQAAGTILANDVYAVVDIPAFPQSSMDGYAFLFDDWTANRKIVVEGEMAAGDGEVVTLEPGKAIRIFTGAAVPPGADTVVMQEKIKISSSANAGKELIIEDESIQHGANVRLQGAEIRKGELGLKKGDYLSPAAIGFLAGIGINEVEVYPKPSISIIVTGKELQQPGKPLQYGQVYESNSFALKAALEQLQLTNIKISWADDDLEILKTILADALKQSDMVLLTGGISVGDYDFVLQAVTECGVQKLFHKVKQRPGKPLYFGIKENKPVFGLPGNPSSVLTCFYQYVIPALEKLSSKGNILKVIKVPLAKAFQKTTNLTHFLKGFYNGNTVLPLDAQESYRLSSFAKANCLVQINEEITSHKEGDLVEIHLLPD